MDAPALARTFAKCLPSPLVAPVTKATRPFKSNSMMLFRFSALIV
jgi:hypothetical protein